MLYLERIEEQLKEKKEDFVSFGAAQKQDLAQYLSVLDEISGMTSLEIEKLISESENVGAIPSAEIDGLDRFCACFGISWNNHEEARKWAGEVLSGRTTFAADGSQYYSEKETSLPVGAVQIGWFENPHNSEESYEKDAELTILSPNDLLKDQEEPIQPDSRVNEARFIGEVKKVGEFLTKKRGWQDRGERMPLAFFDGTLLVSFALPQTQLQKKFIQELINLVRHSREMKVPFLGYIDRSLSRDLLNLIDAASDKITSRTQTLHDGGLLHSEDADTENVLKNWGDRTPFCYSKRKGLDSFIDPETERSLVGFTYLQTTGDSLPARLDIPAWVYESGLLDEVLDVVRAECVIGLGYPYAIETADQTAVISFRDRQILLGALQDFAKENKLNFSVSRKNASKGRRR
ncbi:MAG: DNA double-strand break repair nuclease NurA [Acidobacteria bacterium]|nr:DNA double-strand break repair nuclease NurA [Acidobacteriota bacterium]